jgi:hypothetical protein
MSGSLTVIKQYLLLRKTTNFLFLLPVCQHTIVTGLIYRGLHYLNKNYAASQSYYQKAVNVKPGAIKTKFGYVKPLSFLQQW